jgi:hypothetical protein
MIGHAAEVSWAFSTDWAGVLEAIGVAPLPGATSLSARRLAGMLDGKRIELSTAGQLSIRVALEPPLDLGLSVEPQGVLPSRGFLTEHAAFDAIYTALADEPARAQGLLSRRITETLVDLLRTSMLVHVADDVIVVAGEGEAWLRRAAPLAVEVALRIDDGRARLPAPRALAAHRVALGRFASENWLRLDDAPIRLSGTPYGVRVTAMVRRISHAHFVLEASLGLGDSLNLDLDLRPATLLTPLRALLPGLADLRIGDAAFDAAYDVRTSAPDTLARCLDLEGRGVLLACATRTRAVRLHDEGLTFALPLRAESPDEPVAILGGALGLLARMSSALRSAPPSPSRGPFR